jgi:hypothetical protein
LQLCLEANFQYITFCLLLLLFLFCLVTLSLFCRLYTRRLLSHCNITNCAQSGKYIFNSGFFDERNSKNGLLGYKEFQQAINLIKKSDSVPTRSIPLRSVNTAPSGGWWKIFTKQNEKKQIMKKNSRVIVVDSKNSEVSDIKAPSAVHFKKLSNDKLKVIFARSKISDSKYVALSNKASFLFRICNYRS